MTDPARHSVSVAGVVVDDAGRCLLTRRRDNGNWEAPGGVLEVNETITDGLRRELREETGLEVEPVSLTGVYKNMRIGVVALVFRCRAVGGVLTPNSEVTEFRWAHRGELGDLMAEAYRVRVTDALEEESTPAIRSHDGRALL
ncbi:NUDIX hydrolase [Yinghuangia seranimata]|uniref:NUDIX hydrolase n=1 Tax=Yinghuangia seranimata TaxID=408067 RepID=UPI00248B1AFE|nr:NUDIX domain-containing protein [Yinghuangia seranimata]MDI2126938.1 NUDIX domain-containing protein [Yinghuangia seranimata]